MYNYTRTYIGYKYNNMSIHFLFEMIYLNGEYYVEVKNHRCRTYPTENIILRKRDPPTSLRTQYQVQNDTQFRKNQKVIRDDDNELLIKIILKINN